MKSSYGASNLGIGYWIEVLSLSRAQAAALLLQTGHIIAAQNSALYL